MFRRPFKVKSNTQMKGCDKKKLKQELAHSFPLLTAENLEQIVPTKDDLHQVKVTVHSGEVIMFYTVDKQPIVFSRNNKLFPTVYLLWRYPHILPYLTTAKEVVPVLQNGADFMSAGIISPHEDRRRYGNFRKNDSVYLNVASNRAAVAVGSIALSSDDMYMSAGRGKCVILMHIFEDELCKFGAAIPTPQLGPVFEEPAPDEPAAETDRRTVENVMSYASATKSNEDEQQSNVVRAEAALQRLTVEESPAQQPEEKDSISVEMASDDDIFMYCFLKALNTSLKNVKLPLLISNFYKVHMIPCCPDGRSIDVKKTKYKKMSNFMRDMATENLIKIEESSPGVQSITQINFSHYLVSGFVDPYPSSTNSAREEKCEEPKVSETYSVTASVLPLFSEFLIKKGESLSVSEVRKYTAEYIRKYKLPLPDDPSMVKVDPVLKNIFYQNGVDETPDVVKWEEVMNKVLQKMSRSFKIVNSKAVFAQREQKGKLPLIDIRIANKSGNKKVTLINNLEAYGINMEEFSRECQRGVAASATINQISGLKSSQLQIQGNQINFIEKILTGKYSIPKKYINGLQFAPKKK